MKKRTLPGLSLRAFAHATVIAALAVAGLAQITTTGIRGIVRDHSGALIPNATIKLTDNSTGIEYSTVSSSDGGFLFPNLQFGSYKLNVTAAGFQTTVIAAITVESGRTTDVSVELKVGAAAETVQVAAISEQLNTTTAEVGGTINNKLVQNLPYAGRESLNFAVLIAGSSRSTSDRNSTFNGLPNASLNITLDGMNNNSQRFKSGGTSFFAFAPARIDAIEEVSVSTTGLGADAGGEGAMQIRMVTRRGSEQYHGKILYQGINEALNANTFFRNMQGLPRNKSRQHNPAGAIGGPLLPFVKRLKNKLFFFAYYESQPEPRTQTFTTPVLSAAAQQGNFTYLGTDGVKRTVNLLQEAGKASHTSTVDPTIAGILSKINASQSGATSLVPIAGIPTEFMQNLLWDQSLTTMQAFPTARVDFQITPNIGWHGTWNLRSSDFNRGTAPYPNNPYDFTGPNGTNTHSSATPYIATTSVDWTIRPNLTNSVSFGVQGNGEYFFIDADPKRFAEQGNRIINPPIVNPTLNNNTTLVGAWIPNVNTDVRNNPVYQFTDTLNWVKGRHTLTMGGTLLHTSFYSHSWATAGIPEYNLGVVTADPINNVLRSALPNINTTSNVTLNGVNTTDFNNALNLYALLTGRVTSVTKTTNADEKTKEYRPFTESMQRYAFTTFGLYFQDSFRIRPTLTLNYGLRWQFDGDIHSGNELLSQPSGANFYGPSTGLFQPGVLSGNQNPAFELVVHPYKRDYMNPAPNFGFAWNPSGDRYGFLGKLLGDGKTVVRGAYSITFFNEGLNSISNSLSGGQGFRQTGTAANGVQFNAGTLELRNSAPTIPVSPAEFGFPIPQNSFSAPVAGNYINPDLVSPYVQNWSLGIQRQITNTTALEIRYVGNKSTHMWHRQNIQEVNIFENGFLNEFKNAQNNLAIFRATNPNCDRPGQAACSFANKGLSGQVPLPIFQAAFGALGNQQALTAAQGFENATFKTNLDQGVAGTLAQTLATSATNICRLAGNKLSRCVTAGFNVPGAYPINLFQANPYLTTLTYQDSNGDNNYNALQVEVKQQYSRGLLLGANYTWSHALGDILNETDQAAGYTWYTYRNARFNYGPSPFDRRHVFNAYWTYDLPFGKGQRFLSNNAILDRLVGGWTLGGRETFATGDPLLLNSGRNTVNNLTQAGVVFGGGFTPEQLQKALSKVAGGFSSTALISNIASIATITQTSTASTSQVNSALYAPASTPGQYGAFIYLRNNNLYTFDMSINKDVRITERMRLTLRLAALNFLNHPFFEIGNSNPTSTSFGQVTAPAAGQRNQGNRTMQFRASFEW